MDGFLIMVIQSDDDIELQLESKHFRNNNRLIYKKKINLINETWIF